VTRNVEDVIGDDVVEEEEKCGCDGAGFSEEDKDVDDVLERSRLQIFSEEEAGTTENPSPCSVRRTAARNVGAVATSPTRFSEFF
jgi:hypothetical protein